MHNSKKRLTLQTAYSKINEQLWINKKVATLVQKQNSILKTNIYLLNHAGYKNTQHLNIHVKDNQKYQNMMEKVKKQEKWIKQTHQMIEERNYQVIKKQTKKIEKQLHRITIKTKRVQKKVQKQTTKLLKKLQIFFQNEQQYAISDNTRIECLQKESSQFEKLVQFKVNQLKKEAYKIKQLNQQMIDLLSFKNILKQQVKQHEHKNYQKTTQFKSTGLYTKESFYNPVKVIRNIDKLKR